MFGFGHERGSDRRGEVLEVLAVRSCCECRLTSEEPATCELAVVCVTLLLSPAFRPAAIASMNLNGCSFFVHGAV